LNIDEYFYELPPEKIAQKPAEPRDSSKLLVLDKINGNIEHKIFSDLPEYFRKGDLIVINDTKVFPARLIGKKKITGGEVEIFLLRNIENKIWEALSKPARRLSKGHVIEFGNGALTAVVTEKGQDGRIIVKLESEKDVEEVIDVVGKTPLPPYIKREPDNTDRERYQTIYAQKKGAVAAPTAGLHFTEKVFRELENKGVFKTEVTLHVGIGTFKPLSEEELNRDNLHSEYCMVPEKTVRLIKDCRKNGGRVFSIGTTTARALESASSKGEISAFEGWTDFFIKHPYKFKSVDCLLTNFHLPYSSLLMMVCAFAGKDIIFKAYNEAVKENYRFYSYGDAMLILE
jgi:S-adenosylmethionine:tRNA ribosyltransferase-isomerase